VAAGDPEFVRFGVWRPDAADRQADANEAKGCVRRAGSYGPFLAPEVMDADADLDTACLGAQTFFDASGDPQTFAGDAEKLYRLVSGDFEDVSKSGGYGALADETWQFEQFGDFIVAATVGEDTQVYELGASTDFDDLSGAPAQFSSVWRHGDFLFGAEGITVYWSAFNNITDWTPDVGTQAGAQGLDQAGGAVMGGTIGEYGAIFQENHIRRVTYVGPPVIFDFEQDAIEKRRGALSRNAWVRLGRLVPYASEQGFFIFDGQQSIPIGENKVDEYFKDRLNYATRGRVCCAYDSLQKAVVWGFPAGDATQISELLIFSLTDREWTHDEIELEHLFEVVNPGFTVETVGNFFGGTNIDVDGGSFSIDAAILRGGGKLMGGVNTDHTLVSFSGVARPCILDTIEAELIPGRRSLVTELWPMVDCTDRLQVSTRVGSRLLPGDPVMFNAASVMNRFGFCETRVDNRFHRGRLQLAEAAGWTRAEGLSFLAKPTAKR